MTVLAQNLSPIREFFAATRNWVAVVYTLMILSLNQRATAGRFSTLMVLAEPLLAIALLYLIRALLKGANANYGTSTILFLASGFLPFYLFVRASAAARKGRGRFGRPLPRITSLDVFFANGLVLLVIWTVMTGVVFLGLWLWGIEQARPDSLARCGAALGILWLIGLGWGLVNSSICRYFPFWVTISGVFSRGMLFLSGVMHLSILYPYWLQRWVIWNPLMHAIDLFRLGVYGTYPSLPDMPYLLKATIAFICIGLIADRATLRRGSQ